MRSLAGLWSISPALALATACGAASQTALSVGEFVPPEEPPAALSVGHAFFIPGEQMSFELSLRGVVGGAAFVAVGQPGTVEGQRIIIVRSRVESTGVVAVVKEVRDDITTWVDLESGRPVRHHADVKFGDKEAVIETSFNDGKGGAFEIAYQRKGRPLAHVRQRLPDDANAYDAHAVLGALRAWEGQEGDHASFYVITGRRLWRNSIRMAGRETITTQMGRFPAIRIDGVARRLTRSLKDDRRKAPRKYTVWLSDDESRLPLLVLAKTEYGDLRVELTDYARPDRRLTSREPN